MKSQEVSTPKGRSTYQRTAKCQENGVLQQAASWVGVATSISDLQKIISARFSRPICKNFVPGKVRKAVDYVITKIQLPGHCLALEIKPRCWCLVLPVLPFLPWTGCPARRTFTWRSFIPLPVWEGHLFENLFKNKTTCLFATCKCVSNDLIHTFLTDLPFGLRY